MSAKPALKLATEYVRIALANFTLSWSKQIERALDSQGLTLTDLANALRCCQVNWTEKQEASNAYFEVAGETTEGLTLTLLVCVEPDVRRVTVKGVF